MADIVFPMVMFIVAFVFGTLAWIAKNVWVNKVRTQLFAFIAIVATLTLMTWVFIYIE